MRPMTPLVLKNLTFQPARTAVSIGGIMLAVVLMFMQLGFLGAVVDTAGMVFNQMDFDLVVRSEDYLHMFEAGSVETSVLPAVASLPGIRDARPLDTVIGGYSKIIDTNGRTTMESRGIAIIGIDPNKPALEVPELHQKLDSLSVPNQVIIDRKSSKDFGPKNHVKFTAEDIGEKAEVNGLRVVIDETLELGTGLAASGAIVVSRVGFERLTGGSNRNSTSLILLRCNDKKQDSQVRDSVIKRLDDLGYKHLQVLTRHQVLKEESDRWRWETPVGLIFIGGVGLAMVVGSVVCYMVLAADVNAKLPEYATLKAMGYNNRYLSRLLVKQAIALAVCSIVPAYILSEFLYWIVSDAIGVEITMNKLRVGLVAGLSIVMCMSAGLFAVSKLAKAEPATLF